MNPVFFWTIATVMAVVAMLAVVVPLFWVRAAEPAQLPRRRLLALAALAVGIPLVSLAIYATLGSPALVASTAGMPAAASPDAPPHAAMESSRAGSTAGGDMAAAIARLEAKLEKSPIDPAGWQLLAQSYDFVGRSDDAAKARTRAGGGPGAGPVNSPSTNAATAAPALGDTASLLSAAAAMPGAAGPNTAPPAAQASVVSGPDPIADAAELARRTRDYPAAVAAFRKRAASGAMSADLWADYADAVGAQRGKLDASSEPMIRQALAIDPNHVKALWLLGSLQTQQGDNRGALASWQKLAQLISPDSPDAKLIAANIEEARGAASGAATPVGGKALAGGASLSGLVQLDPRLKGRVPADTVLFIFAKSVEQPGPPLAVFRTTAASWPVQFVLDDSMAMMPNRKLSDFTKVTVEARLSRSGSANPSAGDLRGASGVLNPRQGATPLRIVIDKEIG